jgi:hypothetical protein
LTQLAPAAQRTLHPPQLFTSPPRFTSQPLPTMPSQFANPREHAPMLHVLELHEGVAFGSGGQTLPHMPQLFTSDEVIAHDDPQHCVPGGHIAPEPQRGTHRPAEHTRSPGHARPHEPQFRLSDWRSVSQPFIAMLSQSPKPRSQFATVHRPVAHAAEPCAIGLHAIPQPPQLFGSSRIGVHASAQHARPITQPVVTQSFRVQRPPVQTSFAPQRTPQPPQLFESLARFVSHPESTRLSQSPKPGSQRPMPHDAMRHAFVP